MRDFQKVTLRNGFKLEFNFFKINLSFTQQKDEGQWIEVVARHITITYKEKILHYGSG